MNKKCANLNKRTLYAVFVVIMCLFCVLFMSACNKTESAATVSQRSYSAYVSYEYPDDIDVVRAVVSFSGKEENLLETKIGWRSVSYARNVWYNAQDVEIYVDGEALYDEIGRRMQDETHVHDGKLYHGLKVVFRYDTIYKSITSDAEAVARSGRYYRHSFALDDNANPRVCRLYLMTQNSASWYTMLIACVIVLAVVLLGFALAIKGRIWQKKKTKSE